MIPKSYAIVYTASMFHHLLDNGKHTHFIDYLAIVNSGISAVALFPQLFGLLEGKPSVGLSPLSFFLIALNSAIWVAYGVHRKTPPLIISSALNGLAAVGIFVLIFVRP